MVSPDEMVDTVGILRPGPAELVAERHPGSGSATGYVVM
jgi:hypothetical protein